MVSYNLVIACNISHTIYLALIHRAEKHQNREFCILKLAVCAQPQDQGKSVDQSIDFRTVNCTEICERPRNRRRLNTLRPPGELMRLRKPCVRNRLRTLGCQVRFVAIRIHSCCCEIYNKERQPIRSGCPEPFSIGYYKASAFTLSNLIGVQDASGCNKRG